MEEHEDGLLPCPLCRSNNVKDVGSYGIVCNNCGLWLGEGTLARKFGGYRELWNMRAKYVDE